MGTTTRKVTDAQRVKKVERLIARGTLSIADLHAWENAEVSRFVRKIGQMKRERPARNAA